jgi:exodeoxyribonuclease-5
VVSTPSPQDFTAGQLRALEAFAGWLQDPAEARPFVLSGHAGTGKTFLSSRLLALVEAEALCWTVAAPTHKAVGVLRQALEIEGLRPTWYPSTVHRLLRLKLSRSEGVERCEPTEQTATALEALGLVLVDEASMVDGALLEILLRCARHGRTRLVFVGDPGQLPPVGEPTSPVFALMEAVRQELTEVVRHGGAVLRLATALRQGLLASVAPPLLPPLTDDRGGQVAVVDRGTWIAEAQAALRLSRERLDPDHARLLCFTNRTLERLVPIARRALHGDLADQLSVLPGEVLITRLAVMAPASRQGLGDEGPGELVLGSNRELLVRDVAPERCDLADLGVPQAPVIETLRVEVEAGEAVLSLRLAPAAASDGGRRLAALLSDLGQRARSSEGRQRSQAWRLFFLVRDSFAKVGPAAVLTVHRSQGSSFNDVFVAPDVHSPEDPDLRRQLLYVAVTRARRRVWLVGGAATNALRQDWQRLVGEPELPPLS